MVVGSGGGERADSLLHKRVVRLAELGVPGAWADYIVAPAEDCVVLPASVSYADGATMTNALTLEIAMHLICPRTSVVLSVPLSSLGRLASILLLLAGIYCIRVVHKQEHVDQLRRETNEPVLLSSSADFSQQLHSLCRQHNVIAAMAIAGGVVGDTVFSAVRLSLHPNGQPGQLQHACLQRP